MKYLSKFTPAEVYLILGQKVKLQEFLKITFIDLIFRGALERFDVERQYHSSQPIRVYDYIRIGNNYKSHIPKQHELFYLSIFNEDNEIEILFRNLIKIGYENSESKYNFKKQLLKNKDLDNIFSKNMFRRIFQFEKLTEYGIQIRTEINKEIEVLNEEFRDENSHKIFNNVSKIGGNIFFVENVTYELLNQIDNDLIREMTKRGSTSSSCSGCALYFDNFSSGFDSGCSSGCGGCGGCSGCAGCGGCG